jgi:two-component system, NarL family, invasion response regulator UvrY
MIRLFIIDDHEIVRRGLRELLKAAPQLTVAGEASSAEEALGKLKKTRCDVVITDMSLPDRSGLELLKQLKAGHPRLPVLVLSMHDEEEYAVRVLRAGAAGYLTKDAPADKLIAAIRKAAQGGRTVSEAVADRLMFEDAGGPTHRKLSDREHQVLCMLAGGDSVRGIAAKLSLSVKTVGTHRARILEKLHMNTTSELILYAVRNALVN